MTSATATATSAAQSSEDEATHPTLEGQSPDRPDSDGLAGGPLRGLGLLDYFVLGSIFLWPCAYLPFFANQAWTPRVMALMIAVPTGMWALALLIRRGVRGAAWAAAVIGWSVVSALFSDNILLSFKGVVSTNSSVLIYSGSIGLWALAHFLSTKARSWVVPIFIAACGLNLLVGVAQVVFRIDSTQIGLVGDRAVGLIGNSMIFGAVMAAAGALCIQRFSRTVGALRPTWWLAGAFAFSLGTAISGSRVATVAVLAAGAIAVLGASRSKAAVAMAVAVLGVMAGTALDRLSGGSRDSLSRLTESGGSAGRSTVWRVSVDAVAERPVTGWGLGRFQRAVQGRYSLDELVSAPHLPNFGDAHNVVVELLVVLGIPGLILVGVFGWFAARRCEPALAIAALAMAITWLLQPMSYHTLPLALVLLGAGVKVKPDTSRSSEGGARRPLIGITLVAIGALPALALGVADIRFDRAIDDSNADGVRAAAESFLPDPILMYTAGNLAAEEALVDGSAAEATLEAFARSTEIEPERAMWWGELAAAQVAFTEDAAAARRTADRAIELDPFNLRAWSVVWVASTELSDDERRVEAAEILCRYGIEPACAETL